MLAAAMLATQPVAAQGRVPALLHTIRGAVFDSVAGAPLTGAVVQVAPRDSTGRSFTATTDSAGRYRIADVPSGRYLVGFDHDALGALSLDAPFRAIELAADAADAAATVNLGIPSGRVVRALLCGDDSSEYAGGVIAGYLRDAGSGAAVPGAAVRVEWRAIVLDPGNFHIALQHAGATVASDGSYVACRLPVDAPLDVVVTAPGYRTVAGLVVVPAGGVARQDLHLADSSAEHGPAIIRGRVVDAKGKPPKAGRALITALGRDVPVQDGGFLLADLPLGSWVVEARVIGTEPQSVLVNAAESGISATMITVREQAQRMDVVTVVGTRDRNLLVLKEVLRRKRASFGTTFMPGSPAFVFAQHTADVLREARGFSYRSPTEVYGRAQSRGGRILPCAKVGVYVNGMRIPDGFAGLEDIAPVSEVLAVEAYPDMLHAPMQWKTMDGTCAVVLVWTRR